VRASQGNGSPRGGAHQMGERSRSERGMQRDRARKAPAAYKGMRMW
jgi:hypothetical protein